MSIEWGPDAAEVEAEERRKGIREWAKQEARREKREQKRQEKGRWFNRKGC